MINKFSEIEELFKEIDKFVDMNLSIYIIGGAALLKRGLKIATKDIDIIVATKQEFLKLQLILKLMKFYCMKLLLLEQRYQLYQLV